MLWPHVAVTAFKKPNAMVMRDGRQMSIRAEELVPGDIVLLQSGDKVPADLRLFRVKGLQIQEAALTAAFVFATNSHGKLIVGITWKGTLNFQSI